MSKINVTKANTYTGHSDCIYTVENGPGSTKFLSAGGDGMVALWDLEERDKGNLIAKVSSSVYALSYDFDEDLLVVGQNYEGIHLMNVRDKTIQGSLKTGEGAIFDIKQVQGKIIISLAGGLVKVVDKIGLTTIMDIQLSSESARCIAVAESRGEFAVGYSDHMIRIFDLETFELKHTIKGSMNSVFTVVYNADQQLLLSGGRDARLRIWNAENGYQEKETINAHMYALNHIEFSPDANYFVTCSMDKSIKVWDSKSFQLLKVIDKARHAGHGTSVNKLFWSSYQNQVVACSDDHSISVWDLEFI